MYIYFELRIYVCIYVCFARFIHERGWTVSHERAGEGKTLATSQVAVLRRPTYVQHTATHTATNCTTHCNTLQLAAKHCDAVLRRPTYATHCSTLQTAAAYYMTLQQVAVLSYPSYV